MAANVSFPGLFCISENNRDICFLKQAILCVVVKPSIKEELLFGTNV